jgi:hypothetical protein
MGRWAVSRAVSYPHVGTFANGADQSCDDRHLSDPIDILADIQASFFAIGSLGSSELLDADSTLVHARLDEHVTAG